VLRRVSNWQRSFDWPDQTKQMTGAEFINLMEAPLTL
jgi:hypothetical protein